MSKLSIYFITGVVIALLFLMLISTPGEAAKPETTSDGPVVDKPHPGNGPPLMSPRTMVILGTPSIVHGDGLQTPKLSITGPHIEIWGSGSTDLPIVQVDGPYIVVGEHGTLIIEKPDVIAPYEPYY